MTTKLVRHDQQAQEEPAGNVCRVGRHHDQLAVGRPNSCDGRYNRPMRLKPREQWICDTCGQVIEAASEGWLEWLESKDSSGTYKKHGFRIVHHQSYSPRNPNRPELRPSNAASCYSYENHPGLVADYHLDHIVGPHGLAVLLGMIDKGPLIEAAFDGPGVMDLRDWVELVRRLAVPHYEEARRYVVQASRDGFFEGMSDHAIYAPATLETVVEKYAPPDPPTRS